MSQFIDMSALPLFKPYAKLGYSLSCCPEDVAARHALKCSRCDTVKPMTYDNFGRSRTCKSKRMEHKQGCPRNGLKWGHDCRPCLNKYTMDRLLAKGPGYKEAQTKEYINREVSRQRKRAYKLTHDLPVKVALKKLKEELSRDGCCIMDGCHVPAVFCDVHHNNDECKNREDGCGSGTFAMMNHVKQVEEEISRNTDEEGVIHLTILCALHHSLAHRARDALDPAPYAGPKRRKRQERVDEIKIQRGVCALVDGCYHPSIKCIRGTERFFDLVKDFDRIGEGKSISRMIRAPGEECTMEDIEQECAQRRLFHRDCRYQAQRDEITAVRPRKRQHHTDA